MPDKAKMPVVVIGGLVAVVLCAVLVLSIYLVRVVNSRVNPPKPVTEFKGVGPKVPMGEFIVNLRDPGHYVKADVTLELNAPGETFEGGLESEGEKEKSTEEGKEDKEIKGRLAKEIHAREPEIKETINLLLGGFRSGDLIGAKGMLRAKEFLKRGLQYMLAGGELKIEYEKDTPPDFHEEKEVIEHIKKEGVKIKNLYLTVFQVE